VFLRREKWISYKANRSSKEEIVLQLLIIGGAILDKRSFLTSFFFLIPFDLWSKNVVATLEIKIFEFFGKDATKNLLFGLSIRLILSVKSPFTLKRYYK